MYGDWNPSITITKNRTKADLQVKPAVESSSKRACHLLRCVNLSTMVNSERSIQFLNAAPEAISESWDRLGQKEKGCVEGRKQKTLQSLRDSLDKEVKHTGCFIGKGPDEQAKTCPLS